MIIFLALIKILSKIAILFNNNLLIDILTLSRDPKSINYKISISLRG